MAEARCGQDQSMRDSRDSGGGRRHSRGPNASAERNKPEQPSSSQGALSSIRAAIMRTSRSTSQEQHRERRSHRRPQITILSAEPMAPSWYPAAPPPSAVQVPPPSYEQVLREKSREQQQHPHPHLFASSSSTPPPPAPSPAAPPPPFSSVRPSPAPPPPAPSRSTIATQTDAPPLPPPPAMTNTTPQTTSAERPATRPSLRRPPRPPKPACPPRPDGDALIRAPTPTPTPTPTPIPTQTPTHMPTHTPISTQTDQPPEKEEEAESAAAAAARPRPRPRSRAGLRPISQEVTSSLPISSLGSIPKSQSMSSEIVVAQPISGGGGGESKLASRPVSSERTGNGAGEDQSDGVCLGAEGVCAGGSQYLQDLLDVFGPDSSAHGHALSHANTGSHLVEEEEEEDEEGGKEVAMTMAVALPPVPVVEVGVGMEERGAMGGTSPRPVPRPRSRQTETLTPPPPSISGSPSPPQPQPRRRSLSTSSNTSQTSSQALEGPTAPKPGLPPRLLPLRPPPIKPAKPPHLIGPCPTTTANQEQGQRLPKRGPPLPPRPKPGHALYKNSQKEDFDLLDLSDTLDDLNTHTDIQACASAHPDIPADFKHAITNTSLMTNASVNTSTHTHMDTQMWTDTQSGTTEGRWDPEGTPPKSLSAQQPESIILSEGKHTTPVMTCVAIFAFRGEARDELSFCEGDVITLTGYVNEEWGRGQLKGHAGIFPLCFTSSPQPQELRKVDANMK
ncbi:SH3 domain-containing protein 19 isoform X2 [Engraulis encrasicolus]|uniref:SH3 domain-containing protein 19 isoform X2 n=1 Tax=Engraulis encrasicolus TaxID=184585 RepID=UPI002FD6A972